MGGAPRRHRLKRAGSSPSTSTAPAAQLPARPMLNVAGRVGPRRSVGCATNAPPSSTTARAGGTERRSRRPGRIGSGGERAEASERVGSFRPGNTRCGRGGCRRVRGPDGRRARPCGSRTPVSPSASPSCRAAELVAGPRHLNPRAKRRISPPPANDPRRRLARLVRAPTHHHRLSPLARR